MCLPFFRRKRDQEDDYYANNYNTANNVNQGAAYIRLLGAGHHFIEDWDQGATASVIEFKQRVLHFARTYNNVSEYPVSSSSAYSRQRDQTRANEINEMNAASKEARARNKTQKRSFVFHNPGGRGSTHHHGGFMGAMAGGAGGGGGGVGGF
ncbi:hypothetical protein FOVSG1_004495 [Fusarium oxysporum f. sp. vasinfectum]